MKNQVCSKEQMEELVKFGVDVSSASMCYVKTGCTGNMLRINNEDYYGIIYPTFTVVDMLNLMPKNINDYYFEFTMGSPSYYSCRYFSSYTENELYFSEEESIIDAVYNTFLQLAKASKL